MTTKSGAEGTHEPGATPPSTEKTVSEREESRIGLLTLIAVGIGFVSGLIAYVLYHLIGLLTNLYYYGRLDFSFASPLAQTVLLSTVAIEYDGKLEYDAKNMRFTNRPEANQYLKPAMRKGWELKL